MLLLKRQEVLTGGTQVLGAWAGVVVRSGFSMCLRCSVSLPPGPTLISALAWQTVPWALPLDCTPFQGRMIFLQKAALD